MHGTLDIRRDSSMNPASVMYQVRYEDLAGNSFVASMNEDDLHELLYERLPLDIASCDLVRQYDLVRQGGHVSFPEMEVKEDQLAGVGLKYLATEG